MASIKRHLGRAAATAAVTAAIVGAGAASAFATPGHGGHHDHSWSWSAGSQPQQGGYSSYRYSWGADGSYSWSWGDQAQQSYAPLAAQTTTAATTSNGVVSTVRASGWNTYAYGNCTWYAYERRVQLGLPVGSNWGNANSWASTAAAQGYAVSSTPTVGAVMTSTAGWLGHVAIVESINGDGSITVSEMNWVGYDVTSTRTIAAGYVSSYRYIA